MDTENVLMVARWKEDVGKWMKGGRDYNSVQIGSYRIAMGI